MHLGKEVIERTALEEYGDRSVRMVYLESGEVLFLAYDIAKNILGTSSSYSLTKAVDERSKIELVLTFVEDCNPQKYILVNLDGLMCMTYRARRCEVNRLDFINWAKEKSVN